MPHIHSQAPLLPTSFIQGDQGTLIPVYHPEALDHYMSSGGHATSPPQFQAQPARPQHVQSHLYPFSAPISQVGLPIPASQQFSMNQVQPQPAAGVTWNSGSQQLQPISQAVSSKPPANVVRGPYAGTGHQPFDQRHATPPLRRYQRRDQQNTFTGSNTNRNNNHPRGGLSNNRFPRGGMTSGDHQQDSSQHPPSLPAHFMYNSGSGFNSLTQWASGH
jgi:hypothetical protein